MESSCNAYYIRAVYKDENNDRTRRMVSRKKFFSRHRGINIGVGLIALVVVAAVVSRLDGRTHQANSSGQDEVPVTAAAAIRSDVPQIVNSIGTVQSIDSVNVQPRVTGSITKIEFTPGQDVKQGQELFLIDPRPYQAALDQAKAQLAHDQGVLEEAKMDLARYQALAKQAAIAEQQAQDQAYVVQQDAGTVQLDQANVEAAQLNLEYCHVAAPISGRAGALLIDLGNLVGPQMGGQTAAGGTAATNSAAYGQAAGSDDLVSITQLQPIYVSFNVPQTMLGEIMQQQAASALEVDAYSQSGELLDKGKVTLINNQINTSTGTVELQGTFANGKAALWPGEFVRVKLIVSTLHNVVTVPASAVMDGPNGSYVYVVNANNKARRVNVQVTERHSDIAVIKSGVSAGEKVVTNGQYRLGNGVAIAIQAKTTETG
jgi:membrane fusion protein, multidrug efflux system